jgi:hypothetical protein
VSSNLEDVACFVAVLARYAPAAKPAQLIAREALAIRDDAARLHALAEHECNRGLTAQETAREQRIQQRVVAVLAEYGVTPDNIRFNGDPRGAALKIRFKNGETHGDFGGEGLWCV